MKKLEPFLSEIIKGVYGVGAFCPYYPAKGKKQSITRVGKKEGV